LLDIEPIIGAFFCGIILNKFIIRTSPLFKRIDFIGNTLFIPIFLISVGLLANFNAYVQNPYSIISVAILIVAAVAGKYIAALVTRLLFQFTTVENNLVFGLSVSRAASAIAIILIGFNLGIVNEFMINHTVIIILATCIISSYFTQAASKRVALEDQQKKSPEREKETILVPLANPENMANLLEFATTVKESDSISPVYPLSVVTGSTNVQQRIEQNHDMIQQVINQQHSDTPFDIISRIDSTVTNGIVRASHELRTTFLIVGWHGKETTFESLFGGVLNNLLKKTSKMILVVKTPTTELNELKRINLFVPEYAEFEKGFMQWMDKINLIAKRVKSRITVFSMPTSLAHIKKTANELGYSNFSEFKQMDSFELNGVIKEKATNELLVLIHFRRKTFSFNRQFDKMVKSISKNNLKNNTIIIYPEQN
jgi:hypothetical protein